MLQMSPGETTLQPALVTLLCLWPTAKGIAVSNLLRKKEFEGRGEGRRGDLASTHGATGSQDQLKARVTTGPTAKWGQAAFAHTQRFTFDRGFRSAMPES